MAADYILYSDGGAELRVSGASACIIESCSCGTRVHIAANLGGATNNEAEIFAGLLGFAFLRAKQPSADCEVRWVCDSEYVLKSATQYIHNWRRNGWTTAAKKPVKNQGLWQVYSALSEGISIVPEHVRGHTGHPENEACDAMTNWVRANEGDFSGGAAVSADYGGEIWTVLDMREALRRLRADVALNHEVVEALLCGVAEAGDADPADAGVRKEERAVARAVSGLKQSAEALEGLSSKAAAALRSDIEKLLKKHRF